MQRQSACQQPCAAAFRLERAADTRICTMDNTDERNSGQDAIVKKKKKTEIMTRVLQDEIKKLTGSNKWKKV